MTRDTSKEAYDKIKANGLLGERQLQAYEVLYLYGPLTASEIWDHVKRKYGITISSQGAGSRLSELRQKGVVDEVGYKKDSITGMEVILWDVTSGIPKKIKNIKKKSNVDEAVENERKACAEIAYNRGSRKIGNLIMERGHQSLFKGE